MFNVIMVHTDGSLTEKTATDIEKLYTVCQFRNDTHFTCLTCWAKNGIQYQLYGKPKNKNTKLNIITIKMDDTKEYNDTAA